MKIDRVVAALDNNKTYTGFWDVFSKVWNVKFGVIPTLMFVGTEEELESNSFSKEHGEVYRLDPLPEVVVNPCLDWSVTWSLFYGPTLFPSDVCMTSGIDQIPLSEKFLRVLEPHDIEKYVVGFSGAYRDLPDIFPSSHHVALGKNYKEIYNIENSWHDELRKVFSNRGRYKVLPSNCWGLDEVYSSEMLRASSSTNIVHENIFHDDWVPFRLDRGARTKYDVGSLRAGKYTELHSPRPYEEHKEYIDKLVEELLDERS